MDWEAKATLELGGHTKSTESSKLLKNHEETEADISMEELLAFSNICGFLQLPKLKGDFIWHPMQGLWLCAAIICDPQKEGVSGLLWSL